MAITGAEWPELLLSRYLMGSFFITYMTFLFEIPSFMSNGVNASLSLAPFITSAVIMGLICLYNYGCYKQSTEYKPTTCALF
jgi:hypothetical protein